MRGLKWGGNHTLLAAKFKVNMVKKTTEKDPYICKGWTKIQLYEVLWFEVVLAAVFF
jgi:hypothetical protein